MRNILINAYLDYRNNYLSLALWAEHNGLTLVQASDFMNAARDVANSAHPEA